jgi:predicted adenylyl cyclase CyaB
LIEVERKCWVVDKQKVLTFLYENATLKTETIKKDTYYIKRSNRQNKKSIIHKNDQIFRIRLSNNKYFVTFKEKVLKDRTEINTENEFEIIDHIAFIRFINYLGFTKLIDKIKETKLFILDGVNLEYNHLHSLGYFLEAEVICEERSQSDDAISKIDKVFSKMGIQSKDIEIKMYIELLLEGINDEGI